ncbi:MAG: alanine racemase [Myxococcota bacterium]|nr:alanine racemase [Myxococcota bacterium]
MQIDDLRTPAMLVDLDRLERNCARMARRAAMLGVNLRPHVKTHKVGEIARLQAAGQFGGITVSTLAEARHFRNVGFTDITWAVPMDPRKAREAMDLPVNLLVDSMQAIDAIEHAASPNDAPVVWLKVDCGYGRAGVDPHSAEALQVVERLADHPFIRFAGLLTHGGQSYACVGPDAIARVARIERDAVVDFAERIRAKGWPVPGVSVGSTPTMMHVDHLDGVTEMRPGNYALFDAFQAQIGACSLDDVAASVLATVISVHPDRAIVDAGALALSKDAGTGGTGFGLVLDVHDRAQDDLTLVALSQEHGTMVGVGVGRLSVGDRVRILPNHSCLTMACFATVYGVRAGFVEAEWSPCRGW